MDPGEILTLAARQVGVHPECVASCALVAEVCAPGDHALCGTHLWLYPGAALGVPTLVKGVVRASMDLESPGLPMAYLAGGVALLGERDPLGAMNALYEAMEDVKHFIDRRS